MARSILTLGRHRQPHIGQVLDYNALKQHLHELMGQSEAIHANASENRSGACQLPLTAFRRVLRQDRFHCRHFSA